MEADFVLPRTVIDLHDNLQNPYFTEETQVHRHLAFAQAATAKRGRTRSKPEYSCKANVVSCTGL